LEIFVHIFATAGHCVGSIKTEFTRFLLYFHGTKLDQLLHTRARVGFRQWRSQPTN